jgi:hypothetical protein
VAWVDDPAGSIGESVRNADTEKGGVGRLMR